MKVRAIMDRDVRIHSKELIETLRKRNPNAHRKARKSLISKQSV